MCVLVLIMGLWADPPYHLGSVWRPRVQTGQACSHSQPAGPRQALPSGGWYMPHVLWGQVNRFQ